jgi:hypothetical protein
MKKHFELFGFKVKDLITGREGVVTSISFDLYGCVQAIVQPGVNTDGNLGESHWFDIKRLVAISDNPVMPLPCFDSPPGGETKPLPSHC